MQLELKRLDTVIEKLQRVRNTLSVNYALELRIGDSLGNLEIASTILENVTNRQLKDQQE